MEVKYIKDLRLNDLVTEYNPYGFQTESMVCERPLLADGVWLVTTVSRSFMRYKFRQKEGSPDIINRTEQVTVLKYT